MGKIQGFEQLEAWQKAQDLAVSVYRETKSFPREEAFGLTNQLRRAVASVSANIAEGFGRSSVKEKLQFYNIAYGSLLEVKNFIYLSGRLGFITAHIDELLDAITTCQKLLNGLLRSTRNHQDD